MEGLSMVARSPQQRIGAIWGTRGMVEPTARMRPVVPTAAEPHRCGVGAGWHGIIAAASYGQLWVVVVKIYSTTGHTHVLVWAVKQLRKNAAAQSTHTARLDTFNL